MCVDGDLWFVSSFFFVDGREEVLVYIRRFVTSEECSFSFFLIFLFLFYQFGTKK